MPMQSSQISQLIGGQMAMFSNNAAFSHQIGAAYTGAPVFSGMGQGPSYGRQHYAGQDLGPVEFSSAGGLGAGAMGMAGAAIPGAAAGAAVAGGLGMLGAAGNLLDPTQMVGGGFARGAAAGGLGGGLMGAAGPAALMYGAYRGLEYMGQQTYQGAQNISNVGQMAQQYMAPQFGETGARPGGRMAPGQVKEILSTLHEIASEETMASMKDVSRLMDRFGQMGMLTGIGTPQQFKQKFQGLVGQVRQIAEIMGTSLEEAAPMLGQMQQMGLWRPQDIMGATTAMATVGAAARPQLMQTMQAGAQRSHAMGGSLAAGAAMGRQQFLNIQSRVRQGSLTNEGIMEFTGGVGGVQGQRMMAERMTGIMQSATQSPVGRLAMAALGETGEEGFTGRIDQEALARMQRGDIGLGELQGMARRKTRGRQGAASFTWRQEQIGQEMMAQGGEGLMGQMFQAGLEKAGYGGASEDIQGLMLQRMYGLQRRDAMAVQKMMKDAGSTQERTARREMDAIKDAFQRAEETQYRSWEGFKGVFSRAMEEGLERPYQEFVESIGTRLNEETNRLTDTIWGRTKQLKISQGERMRMLAQGAAGGVGMGAVGEFMTGGVTAGMATPAIERMERGRRAGGTGLFGQVSGALQGLTGLGGWGESGMGTRAQSLVNMGARTQMGTREEMPAGAIVLREQGMTGDLGEDIWGSLAGFTTGMKQRGGLGGMFTYITEEEAKRTRSRAVQRAQNPANLFKVDDQNKRLLARVKAAYTKVITNSADSRALNEYRKGEGRDPARYMKRLLEKVKREDPEAFEALRLIKGGDGDESDRDALAFAQGTIEHTAGLEADFAKVAGEGPGFLAWVQEPAKVQARTKELTEEMTAALTERTGEVETTVIPGMRGFKGEIGASQVVRRAKLEGLDISAEKVAQVMGGPHGNLLADYLETGKSTDALTKARSDDPGGVGRIFDHISQMKGTQQETRFKAAALEMARIRKGKAFTEAWQRRKKLASDEVARIGELDLQEGIRTQFSGVLEKYQITTQAGQAEAASSAQALAEKVAGDRGALAALRGSGAVGRHIAGMAGISGLKGGGEGQFRRQIRKAGLGQLMSALETPEIAEQLQSTGRSGERMQEILSDKRISASENVEIKNALMELAKKVGPQAGAGGVQSEQEKMAAELTRFAGASEKFVMAVRTAVPALGELEAYQIDQYQRGVSEPPPDDTGRGESK